MTTSKFKPGEFVTWNMLNPYVHSILPSGEEDGLAHMGRNKESIWKLVETITVEEYAKRKGRKWSGSTSWNICILKARNGKTRTLSEEYIMLAAKQAWKQLINQDNSNDHNR